MDLKKNKNKRITYTNSYFYFLQNTSRILHHIDMSKLTAASKTQTKSSSMQRT